MSFLLGSSPPIDSIRSIDRSIEESITVALAPEKGGGCAENIEFLFWGQKFHVLGVGESERQRESQQPPATHTTPHTKKRILNFLLGEPRAAQARVAKK
jgi:hypothetical protein